jgi:hypothetical protein
VGLLREQHPRRGVFEHEGQPLFRVSGVERHVDAAGLEHRQHPDHQLDGALDHDADRDLRPDAPQPEAMRELVGPYVQVAVSDLRVFVNQGRGVGRAFNLSLEQFVQADGAGILRGRVVPGGELELLLLAQHL